MHEKPPQQLPISPARQARLEREAAALRENLRKRKDQARARQPDESAKPEPDDPER